MTEIDKQLLLKDLSSRLPYGVKCFHPYGVGELNSIDVEDYGIDVTFKTPDDNYYSIEQCKPYLRPMSSMTEEEKKELLQISNFNSDVDDICYDSICCIERTTIDITDIANFISWLNAHHFDYRVLIKKGLAIEAPKDMYK